MTTVKIREFYCNGLGYHDIDVEGHVVRKDPERNDACVAASILSQTLLQTLRNHVPEFCSYRDNIGEDAHVWIMVYTYSESESFVKALFEQAGTGFMMLKDAYPDDFTVDWNRDDGVMGGA